MTILPYREHSRGSEESAQMKGDDIVKTMYTIIKADEFDRCTARSSGSGTFTDLRVKDALVVVLAGFIFSVGCASTPPQAELVSQHSAPMYDVAPPPDRCEGSLWNEQGPLCNLFVNQKARRVGDIITINIVESSAASNNATTKTARTSGISGGVQNFFGLENDYTSDDKFFNPFGTVKGDLSSTFDGNGTTTRSGQLNAYMTARITELLPNGDYKIVGTRDVTVNNEKQYMMLAGLVRPRDVSADNVVLSTYIADAKISYSGAGIINDRQQPGWLARVLDSVWPF